MNVLESWLVIVGVFAIAVGGWAAMAWLFNRLFGWW